MQCEMCGKDSPLLQTMIEGTTMNVCKNCAHYGKVIKPVIVQRPEKTKKKVEETQKEPEKAIITDVVEDFAKRIRQAREAQGLTQEDLAKRLSEKLSWIHNLECGKSKPSIALAQKIGKFLNIRLTHEYEEENAKDKKSGEDIFTIGDFIAVKKK